MERTSGTKKKKKPMKTSGAGKLVKKDKQERKKSRGRSRSGTRKRERSRSRRSETSKERKERRTKEDKERKEREKQDAKEKKEKAQRLQRLKVLATKAAAKVATPIQKLTVVLMKSTIKKVPKATVASAHTIKAELELIAKAAKLLGADRTEDFDYTADEITELTTKALDVAKLLEAMTNAANVL